MSNLNQMELNAIREIAGAHITCASKLMEYSERCQDPQIKQMFHQSAMDASKNAQDLINML